ncbi:MAG: hypothetical protein LBR15_04805 [Methanobrevibacter sp.]|jgi:hypothetical protein|nr:hypothetical protein [Candidatus Methanovirga australis]
MIDTKQAIESSINYIRDVYEQLPDLRVEEIELSDNEEFWIITLGWDEIKKNNNLEQAMNPLFRGVKRAYKTFFVDSESGDIKKMKIWKGDCE